MEQSWGNFMYYTVEQSWDNFLHYETEAGISFCTMEKS